jgi:hypothetical protein
VLVAQRGAGTAGQNGGHEEAVPRHIRPPDRINAVPEPVELSVRNPMRDPVSGEAELAQLPVRDHEMLPPDERPEGTPPPFRSFAGHDRHKSGTPRRSPLLGRLTRCR